MAVALGRVPRSQLPIVIVVVVVAFVFKFGDDCGGTPVSSNKINSPSLHPTRHCSALPPHSLDPVVLAVDLAAGGANPDAHVAGSVVCMHAGALTVAANGRGAHKSSTLWSTSQNGSTIFSVSVRPYPVESNHLCMFRLLLSSPPLHLAVGAMGNRGGVGDLWPPHRSYICHNSIDLTFHIGWQMKYELTQKEEGLPIQSLNKCEAMPLLQCCAHAELQGYQLPGSFNPLVSSVNQVPVSSSLDPWVVIATPNSSNHRCSHATAFVRVEHRPPGSSGMPSVSPRFDECLHVHICLSPVKLLRYLRLNAFLPQLPSPWRQPEGSPAGQAVCIDEALDGCHRHSSATSFFATNTAGPRRRHLLLLYVIFVEFASLRSNWSGYFHSLELLQAFLGSTPMSYQ